MIKSILITCSLISLSVSVFSKEENKVWMKTSKGGFCIELYPKKAPKTVENFKQYVQSGFYKGTVFHRVIRNFMIQGGGFDTNLQKKETRKPIENEANNGLENQAFSVAMARTNDPHSATSQFFINVKDNNFLNYKASTSSGWGYAVFGKVVKGTTVINKIKQVATKTNGPHQNVPIENVIIEDVTFSCPK